MPGMIQPPRELDWTSDGRLLSVKIQSPISGKWHAMECSFNEPRAITRAQWDAWQGGQHIQTAMPQLTADEREFLMSGITPEEWEAEFGEED